MEQPRQFSEFGPRESMAVSPSATLVAGASYPGSTILEDALSSDGDDPEKLEEKSRARGEAIANAKLSDVEKGSAVASVDYQLEDVLWVDWDGPDDPSNPQNWLRRRKWAVTFVVSAFNFISPASSSMIAPASEEIGREFGITKNVLISMITSAFVLGYAVGPLVVGPMSEIYGRSRIIIFSNLFYLVWSVGCGFAQNTVQILTFRFLAGVGGSASLSVGGAIVGDIFHPDHRGQAMAIYSFVAMLGPVIGPVCAGWITQLSTWRWIFWSISLFDVLIQIFGILLLEETFPPILLEKKAQMLRASLLKRGAGGGYQRIKSIYDTGIKHRLSGILFRALARPIQLICREPIIQLFSLYTAFVYGIFYLYLTRMPFIFADVYNQTPDLAGLQYIALGLGLSMASLINAFLVDRIYLRLKRENRATGEPEFRLPSMVPGTLMLPLGLVITGWAVQKKVHWVVTDLGIGCVGMGMILNFQSMQTYIVDAFILQSASALAIVSCLRAFAGFGFPLFGAAMFGRLGYGTILAALSVFIGYPAPWILWKYGKRIRERSPYAQAAVAVH